MFSIQRMLLAGTALVLLGSSCTSIKMAVPDGFRSQATELPVKGLGGLNARKALSFGSYRTSKIKRGWHTTSAKGSRLRDRTDEEWILRAMGVNAQSYNSTEKDQFRYTIADGRYSATVYGMERMTKNEMEVKTGSRALGDFSRTNNYQYHFSALVQPSAAKPEEHWKLELYNIYERSQDTARRIFGQPYVEERGMLTNGKDTITIRPVRVSNFTTSSGKETKFPVRILAGYELRMGDGVIAIVDAFGKNVWFYNELDAQTKLLVASVSSALLLRRVQDVKG
jgi:hypothetical protein